MNGKVKNKKIIFAWLKKGEDDLSFAKRTLEETDFYDYVCFLSQQAVEKHLKAIIIIQKGEITKKEKTHNLIYLSQVCKSTINLKNFEEEFRLLSEGYITSRYPAGGYVKASKEEAQKCFDDAEKILNFIKEKIDFSIYLKD